MHYTRKIITIVKVVKSSSLSCWLCNKTFIAMPICPICVWYKKCKLILVMQLWEVCEDVRSSISCLRLCRCFVPVWLWSWLLRWFLSTPKPTWWILFQVTRNSNTKFVTNWKHHSGSKIIWIKTEPVTAGADATLYIWLLCTYIWPKNQTYFVASAPTVTGSVLMQRSSILGDNALQCAGYWAWVTWTQVSSCSFTIWQQSKG